MGARSRCKTQKGSKHLSRGAQGLGGVEQPGIRLRTPSTRGRDNGCSHLEYKENTHTSNGCCVECAPATPTQCHRPLGPLTESIAQPGVTDTVPLWALAPGLSEHVRLDDSPVTHRWLFMVPVTSSSLGCQGMPVQNTHDLGQSGIRWADTILRNSPASLGPSPVHVSMNMVIHGGSPEMVSCMAAMFHWSTRLHAAVRPNDRQS